MKNINDICELFINQVQQFKNEINKDVLDFNSKADQILSDRASIVERSKKLDEREKEIKKIEDVLSLESDNKKKSQNIKVEAGQLDKARDAFENYKNETLKNLNIRSKELDERSKYVENEYKALIKAQKAMKEEQETYKDKVAKSIVDLANKK